MKIRSFKRIILTLSVLPLILSGCDLAESYTKIDRSGDMSKGDYRKALDGKPAGADPFADEHRRGAPNMMSLSQEDARTSNITGNIPVVSVSVNQMVPLKDILFDLSNRADFNLILDPAITGSIIYTARSKPFDQVIAEISNLAGLMYEFNGRNLRIELDRPYMKRYNMPYLNITRGFESSVSAAVQVASGEGAGNGSNYSLNSSSESDFWTSLTADIAQIMGLSEEFHAVLRTAEDPQFEVIQISSDQLESNTDSSNESNSSGDDIDSMESSTDTEDENSSIDESAGEATTDDSAANSAEEERLSFIVNRMAGIITVFGTEKQHELIAGYLNEMKRSVGTQILIEAKILEVELSDEFSAGITWSALFKESLGISNMAFSAGAPLLTPAQGGNFTFTIDGADIDSTVSALNRFGTVRALASPRLAVMNNQSAALNVARNRVFFDIEIEQSTEEGVTTTEIDTTAQTVPEGVIINVMPMADPDTGEVMMSVRPSITRVDSTVNDPGVAFLNVPGIESQIPVVDVREIDTMVKMMSGEVVVIGGLMQDRSVSSQEGIPVMHDIPVLGGLFRNQGDKVQKYEIVILLRAVVVDGRSNVHPTDKYLYKNFASDRRPFKM